MALVNGGLGGGDTIPPQSSGSAIDELTGDVTAGPGAGSQPATLVNTANVKAIILADAPGGTIPPATTVTGPDAFGAAAVVGVGTPYARNDHNHGLPSLAAAGVSELELTVNTPVVVLTHTPAASGRFLVNIYYRVVTAPTAITLVVSWTDATGAQTFTPLSGVTQAIGSYTVASFMVYDIGTDAIAVTATAGTANQVYVSASLVQG